MKKILITGATGLVGSHLLSKLIKNEEYTISILTRNKAKAKKELQFPIDVYEWNLDESTVESNAFKDQDVVIHLAGESVASRWSQETKKEIISSRTKSSKLIVRELHKYPKQTTKVISASAIGIYGDQGDNILTERSNQADTFLANVCKEWENIFLESKYDSYILRIGVVLSTQGGALKQMLPIFKANLGGKLGHGEQFMSWIHIDDLVEMLINRIEKTTEQKIFNATAPTPVSNKEFTKTLASSLNKLALFSVPEFILRFIVGEMSQIVLSSQNVIPKAFLEEGFEFKFPQLKPALDNILKYQKKGEGLLIVDQWINKPLNEVFDFFSEAKNLERITPEYLNFKVLGMDTPTIQKGSLIDYKLKLRGIPFRWKTLISEFTKDDSFVDQQEKGPYKKWHHTHKFTQIHGGTLITDKVVYKLPFGQIGQLIAGRYVKNDVNKIFNYRKKVIAQHFDSDFNRSKEMNKE